MFFGHPKNKNPEFGQESTGGERFLTGDWWFPNEFRGKKIRSFGKIRPLKEHSPTHLDCV